MRYAILGAVVLWMAAIFYLMVSWDFSPDTFLEWASIVISIGGVVLGFSATLCGTAAVLREGHVVGCASEERVSRL